MGQSEWVYLIPYQEDIDQAIQELRQHVFEDGEYYKGFTYDEQGKQHLMAAEDYPDYWPYFPDTIEELLEIVGDTGTHSIIDWPTVPPVGEEELRSLFGTVKPTERLLDEAQVEEGPEGLWYYRGRIPYGYIVLYDEPVDGSAAKPILIFIKGISGD